MSDAEAKASRGYSDGSGRFLFDRPQQPTTISTDVPVYDCENMPEADLMRAVLHAPFNGGDAGAPGTK